MTLIEQTALTYKVYPRLIAHVTLRLGQRVESLHECGCAIDIIPPQAVYKRLDWLKRALVQDEVFLQHMH